MPPSDTDDIRTVVAWSANASAGVTTRLIQTWLEAGVAFDLDAHDVSIWLGGTLSDVDDLTDADEFAATTVDNVATIDLDVPLRSTPMRLVLDGGVLTAGTLYARTSGTDEVSDDITVNVAPLSFTINLGNVIEISSEGGQVEQVVAGAGVSVDSTDPTAPVVTAEVTQAELNAEAAARAAADTALDGRLDIIEALGALATDAELAATIAALSTVYQPIDADLTAIAALSTTAFGRSLLTGANAAALRTLLELGTAATSNTGDFDAAGAAAAAQAASQPLDSDLTAIAALATTAFGRGLLTLADDSALRTAAGLILGTDIYSKAAVDGLIAALSGTYAALAGATFAGDVSVPDEAYGAGWNTSLEVPTKNAVYDQMEALDAGKQDADGDLTDISALSPANDDVIQRKAGAWTNRTIAQLLTDLAAPGTTFQPLDGDLTALAALTTTAFGRALLELANAGALRTAAGLGSMATETATDYVAKALYDANTILIATSDNTPLALTVAASRIVGRKSSGDIDDITGAEAAAILAGEVFKQAQEVNAQTGTTYTLVAGDAGKLVTLSNASAITLTVPQDSDATIAIGTYVDLYQLGAGQVTVAAGTGATLRTSGLTAKARAQYARFGVQKVSANTWSLYGDLAAS